MNGGQRIPRLPRSWRPHFLTTTDIDVYHGGDHRLSRNIALFEKINAEASGSRVALWSKAEAYYDYQLECIDGTRRERKAFAAWLRGLPSGFSQMQEIVTDYRLLCRLAGIKDGSGWPL